MKFILGLKKNMTQVFNQDGIVLPVTVLEAGPIVIIQKKNKEKDGYDAIQVGYGNINPKKLTKADIGHRKNLGNFRHLREFRLKNENDLNKYNVGDKIDASFFNEGDKVKKGKIIGFIGNSGTVFFNGQLVPLNIRNQNPHLGSHLHFEVRKKGTYEYLNPLNFIDWAWLEDW